MSDALLFLSRDAVMNQLIEKHGELTLTESENYFDDLVGTIIGQQLSGKAAQTIYNRVAALAESIRPERILEIPDGDFRQAGMSFNKIKYMKNLSLAVLDKSLDLENLKKYDDGEVMRQLTAIKGFGNWTAEMFLIFSLAREDVFSFGDGGLARAVNTLYGNGAELSKPQIAEISGRWKPFRSIASLYLWRSLDSK